MDLTEETIAGIAVVTISGRLDAGAAPSMRNRLTALLEGGSIRVVVDAGALTYVGSAGLRVLLISAQDAETKGGRLLLATPTPPVRRVVELAGFDKLIEVHPTREAALASFGPGRP